MAKEALKIKDGTERLKGLKLKGCSILICDFSDCSREEGGELFLQLLERLQKEPESSVRLLLDVQRTTHDATQANEWKRHLETFNSRLKKSAVVGLTPLLRISLTGLRMYARLMGHEKIAAQAQIFDNREAALEYLASDK